MRRPKTTKKRKSSMNIDDGASSSSQIVCHDNELSKAKDDLYAFSKSEDDIDDGESREQET